MAIVILQYRKVRKNLVSGKIIFFFRVLAYGTDVWTSVLLAKISCVYIVCICTYTCKITSSSFFDLFKSAIYMHMHVHAQNTDQKLWFQDFFFYLSICSTCLCACVYRHIKNNGLHLDKLKKKIKKACWRKNTAFLGSSVHEAFVNKK